MCGICGKINFDPDHAPERALVERMCAALRRQTEKKAAGINGRVPVFPSAPPA